jgi:iron complex transport system substrate-binding protein
VKKVLISTLLLLVVFMAVLPGCSNTPATTTATAPAATQTTTPPPATTPATKTIKDMAGNLVVMPENITRIAIAKPVYATDLILLGGGSKIVGMGIPTQYQLKAVPGLANLPNPSNAGYIEVSALIKADPQVFIMDKADPYQDTVKERGIPLVLVSTNTYGELQSTLAIMAKILGGDAPDKAKAYNTYLNAKINLVSNVVTLVVKTQPKATALYLTFHTGGGILGYGNDTQYSAWISAAGGQNLNDKSGLGLVTLDQITAWNPDVIFVQGQKNVDAVLADPLWSGLKAVQNNQVYAAGNNAMWNWSETSVESALQIQWAATKLYPASFTDINVAAETKNFYQTYYGLNITDAEVSTILQAK